MTQPITFLYFNLTNYTNQKLVTRNGKEIVYQWEKLGRRWVVREYSPSGFYHGSTLVRFEQDTDLARWLNDLGVGLPEAA